MNEITRIEPMAVRDKAIAHAGAIRGHFQALERAINRAIVDATDEGVPGVLDKLTVFKGMVIAAHTYGGEQLAGAAAAAFGDTDATVFSGGEDKPDNGGGHG